MAARRPNMGNASADLAFAVLALVSGGFGAPLAYAVLVFVGAAIVWAWTRRAALAAMPLQRRVANSALALAMLAGVLGVAYWIGLLLGGHA